MKTDTATTPSTVINLSDHTLTASETQVLQNGLKFVPKPQHDPVPELATRIQNITKQLPDGQRHAVVHEVTALLHSYEPRDDRSPDNLTSLQRQALKSLKRKKSDLKFLPADKGNAIVILSNNQYINKVNDHLSIPAYDTLDRDPTQSITTKLDRILRKFKTEKKLDPKTIQQMRVLHPRCPQLYGQPKIHKPEAPIRPIVSFYNTPLSALHKTLATFLKPLSRSNLRLKDSSDYKQHLTSTSSDNYPYMASLDVKSLYTSCDMRSATDTAIQKFRDDPDLLPTNISADTILSLINFCLDHSYFEFNGTIYKQTTGGTMGSPLIVELAEIRVTDVEQRALQTCPDPPNSYRHFVDDGIGDFRDKDHADSFHEFMNRQTTDLQYTIEHPTNGSLPFLDILIHPDKSTSVYRKPTHTNLYLKYSSCTPTNTKHSVIRSLTRRAYTHCSPQHLNTELNTVRDICLRNGFPTSTTDNIMNDIRQKFLRPTTSTSTSKPKTSTTNLQVSLPYHPTLTKPLKKILGRHDIGVRQTSHSTLRDTLTQTKTPPPPSTQPNTIYEIPCNDCPASYIGQTKRPLIKRITEHERAYRLNNNYDDTTEQIKSAAAHHGLTTGHTIDWNSTSILTTTTYSSQLDLTEHAALQVLKPTINRADKTPNISSLWSPIYHRITSSFRPRSAHITRF